MYKHLDTETIHYVQQNIQT